MGVKPLLESKVAKIILVVAFIVIVPPNFIFAFYFGFSILGISYFVLSMQGYLLCLVMICVSGGLPNLAFYLSISTSILVDVIMLARPLSNVGLPLSTELVITLMVLVVPKLLLITSGLIIQSKLKMEDKEGVNRDTKKK